MARAPSPKHGAGRRSAGCRFGAGSAIRSPRRCTCGWTTSTSAAGRNKRPNPEVNRERTGVSVGAWKAVAPAPCSGSGGTSRRLVRRDPTIGPHYAPFGWAMRILTTDGNERATLAAARSLVRAGHAVWVTAPMRLSLAGVSRRVRSHTLATDTLQQPADYAAELGTIARQERIDILLPMTDPSVEAVLEHRAALPETVVIPFRDLATYRASADKAHVLELARSSGFDIPETRIIASADECDDALSDSTFFPAVI